jgi:hypothetical protein
VALEHAEREELRRRFEAEEEARQKRVAQANLDDNGTRGRTRF